MLLAVVFPVMFTTQNILITPEILGRLSTLDESRGVRRALGMLAPDHLLALRRIATIESCGSSRRIQGRKLTDIDVEALPRRQRLA